MLEIGQDLAGVVNIYGDDITGFVCPRSIPEVTALPMSALKQHSSVSVLSGLGTKVGKFCCRLAN